MDSMSKQKFWLKFPFQNYQPLTTRSLDKYNIHTKWEYYTGKDNKLIISRYYDSNFLIDNKIVTA